VHEKTSLQCTKHLRLGHTGRETEIERERQGDSQRDRDRARETERLRETVIEKLREREREGGGGEGKAQYFSNSKYLSDSRPSTHDLTTALPFFHYLLY